MPLSQFNLPFLNHNAQREYPLAAQSTGTDKTGSFTLPFEFLVEMDIPINASMEMLPANLFIRQIGVYPTGYSITVAYEGTSTISDVATALIPRTTHQRTTPYNLGGIYPFDDINGKVVIGRLEAIDDQPAGMWEFDPDATRIDPDAVRPQIRGVQALIVANGTQRSVPLTGDIELVPGTNMQIIPVVTEGQDPKLIFNAVEGEGLIQDCICEGDLADAPCIRKINGVTATPEGNFYLVGDECLEIQQTDNGLRITDKCCLPCCGCEELEAITRDLERFNQQRSILETFVGTLQTQVTTMELTVLGSRLGDQGCITCE